MGDVYVADDLSLPRKVALKFLARGLSKDARAVERFIREANATSELEHPNICTIYQTGKTDDGQMFIVMPYYEGGSVQARLEGGPLSIDDAVAFGVCVADALEKVHERGILHRDIKPANLLLTNEGHIKVGDFGIAKLGRETSVTGPGVTVGTLAYMSPEQTRGKEIDGRSDVFSLGVTLYEMLTGKLPFWADNDQALNYLIATEDPKPPRAVRKDIPASLERVISKALAKDPKARYPSMAEMRGDLLGVLREIAPTRAVRIEALIRPVRTHIRTHYRAIALGVVAVAIIAAVVINWQRIQCRLGLCGLGSNKGIAVMRFETSSDDAEVRAFAAGIASDLADRVGALSEYDEKVWIVPPDRVVNVNDPKEARNALGVDAVLTGTITKESDDYNTQLLLLDAKTGAAIDEVAFPTGASWRGSLNNYLADLLEVDVEPSRIATRGCIDNQDAYRSYMVGLGYLRSSGEDALDNALGAFERAVAADPSCADAYIGVAQALFSKAVARMEDVPWNDDAIAAIDHALELDESSADAHLLLGMIMSRRGEKEAAIEEFTRAHALRPRDPVTLNKLAWTNVELGRYDKAEEIDRLAIESNPKYFGPYMDLGFLNYVLGRYDEAIAEFEIVRALAPHYGPTYNYLGALFFMKEDWDAATVAFETSFDLGRTYDACSNLGMLYYLDGRFEDASRMYEWALEYKQGDHMVIGNLGSACYWIDGQRQRADTLFESAIALAEQERAITPDDPVLVAFLAGYCAINHRDRALDYAETAMKMAPDNPEVVYRVAQVYEQVGDRAKALVLVGKALDLGYSIKMLEHEAHFRDLREDPRYALLVPEHAGPDAP